MCMLKAIIGYYELTDYHWTEFFLLNIYICYGMYTIIINHTHYC